MKTIICLGPKACDIGETFEITAAPYFVRLIDRDIEGDNCFNIPSQRTAEDYEKNTPDMSAFLSDVTDEVYVLISGESEVANCALRILKQIRHKKISIVYLTPSQDFISTKQALQEKAIRGILQEYTRSGLFEKMILFDSILIEKAMGPSTIKNYDSLFNSTVKKALENHFFLPLGELIIDSANKPKEVSRIMTFGYYFIEQDQEILFNNLNLIDNKIYHFYFTEQTLENDVILLKTIKENLKNKNTDFTKISYTIRKAPGNVNFCFLEAYTKVVQ
jgi:hypothetical protein